MDTDINTFINNIINSPSATVDDRERIVSLLLKDHDARYVTKEQVEEMIKLVNTQKDTKGIMPEPKQTYEFLSLFSKNDGGLKNLTHDFNFGYLEYDVFMKQCWKEFTEARKKYPKVPNSLIARIDSYAFDSKPEWYIHEGKEKIYHKYGWSAPSFIDWYKKSRIHPKNDSFYNEEMIIPFKESIQVRADTGNLVRLIEKMANLIFGEPRCCKLNVLENVKTAQFYTNVDKLGEAIYQIFSTIKEYSERNFCDEVTVDYIEGDVFKILSITHIGSKPTKNCDAKDYAGGNTKAIMSALTGLCNYEVIAEFPNGAYKKILLSDNYEEYKKGIFPIENEEIKGYTHIMKFY